MSPMNKTMFNPKRTGFRVLVGSIVISAALGIYALVNGEFGDTEGRILLTALAVAAASVATLASGIALERGRMTLIPSAAIAVSIAGFALFIVTIWRGFEPEVLIKAAASVVIVGVALTHWSVVSLARLPVRFRLIHAAAFPLSGLMAAFLIGAIWERLDGEGTAQVGGVIAILTISTTIVLPVLQRLAAAGRAGDHRIRFCPYCGKRLNNRHGTVRCRACDSAFRIRPA